MLRRFRLFFPAGIIYLALATPLVFAQETLWDELTQSGQQALQEKRYEEAEKQFKAALDIVQPLGEREPRLLTSLQNLNSLLKEEGKEAPRELLVERILQIQEDTLGSADPELTNTLSELASVYQRLGKTEKAEAILKRVVEIRESTLGPLDPSTIGEVNSLGAMQLSMGKYREAEEKFRTSLIAHQTAPEPDLEAMAQDYENLSWVYFSQGMKEEAEAFTRYSVELHQQARGEQGGAGSSNALMMLIQFYEAQERYDEAEPLLLQYLAAEEKNLGSNSSNMVLDYQEMARFYRIQGRMVEAESYAQKARDVAAQLEKKKPTGPDNMEAATGLINASSAYMGQGEYARAEEVSRKALKAFEESNAPQYPMVSGALVSVALACCAQGKLEETERLYKRSLQMTEEALGAEHPLLALTLVGYGRCYERNGKFAEAEAIYLRGLKMAEKPSATLNIALPELLSNYARLLREMKRDAEAAQIEARLDALLSK
jgi:tetratricopeptide (TPR) repeat protein